MKQRIFRFLISAVVYSLVGIGAGHILVLPPQIISTAVFLPPVFGLMWGPVGAAGMCAGGFVTMFVLNGFHVSSADIPHFVAVIFWIFLAAYIPYFLWYRWKFNPKRHAFTLTTDTLKKFIAILAVTFAVISVFRALTATAAELNMVTGLFGAAKRHASFVYMCVIFVNDFLISTFFDVTLLFTLISMEISFHNPNGNSDKLAHEERLTEEENNAIMIGSLCYLAFPIIAAYMDVYQIYGMDNLETWITFVAECIGTMTAYVVLITYLLLRYRRSIMMEMVFFVAMTVFLSAAVLGSGSSIAMSRLVQSHVDDSLRAMTVICRERLDRTFFCMRQAVNGMAREALSSLESYDRLANDAAYRKTYLDEMIRDFSSISFGIDGSVSFYYRLIPEIEGTKGGFSMQREDARWEGSLSPFVRREPVDLAPYSPNDNFNVGWYYIPMKCRNNTWIEPYIDPVTKFYVISYVAPLFVDGKFIGVIGMDVDFNFIIHELRRMSIYDYGYVYLMNRNNVVLYHRDLPQGAIFQPNPEYKEIEHYLTNGMWLGIAMPLSKVHNMRNHILIHLLAAIFIVAMLVSIVSIVLVSRAIRPLAGMTEAAKRIASGDLNVKISYESGNELGLLVRSIREMATKLEIYVYRDKLTGLRNAAAYISKGKELDSQAKLIPDFAYGVILFDVNFLKKVNDNYGHQAGNQLLRHASRVICRVFEHSPVYRVGGDEFVAILEGEDYDNREELLKKFDEKIAEESFSAAGEIIYVSVARGLAIYENGKDFATVAKVADVAMYNHKSAIKAKYDEEVR